MFGGEILNKIIYERSYMYSYDIIRAMIFTVIIYSILRFKSLLGNNITVLAILFIVFYDLSSVNNR